jgi:hypothetical protein
MEDELDLRVGELLDARENGVTPEARGRIRAYVNGVAAGVGIVVWPYMPAGVEAGCGGKMALQESVNRVKAERKKKEWLRGQAE